MKRKISLLFAYIRNLNLTIGSILLKKEIEIHSLSAKKSPSLQFPIGAKGLYFTAVSFSCLFIATISLTAPFFWRNRAASRWEPNWFTSTKWAHSVRPLLIGQCGALSPVKNSNKPRHYSLWLIGFKIREMCCKQTHSTLKWWHYWRYWWADL